jgi:hypothetical protein
MHKPTVDNLRDHVRDLCEDHDISVRFCKRLDDSFALIEFEEVTIPEVKSDVSYAVALHEIGHILGKHQRSKRTLVRERWAWKWAKRAAKVWTPRMETCAERSLSWYVPRAEKLDAQRALQASLNPSEQPTNIRPHSMCRPCDTEELEMVGNVRRNPWKCPSNKGFSNRAAGIHRGTRKS